MRPDRDDLFGPAQRAEVLRQRVSGAVAGGLLRAGILRPTRTADDERRQSKYKRYWGFHRKKETGAQPREGSSAGSVSGRLGAVA
ncbi:MAG: hypothetical protein CME06_10070 [Gemmatimonadetes bacterium]|nr:hypothetical protein [Gemmatimonadota bacterium]